LIGDVLKGEIDQAEEDSKVSSDEELDLESMKS